MHWPTPLALDPLVDDEPSPPGLSHHPSSSPRTRDVGIHGPNLRARRHRALAHASGGGSRGPHRAREFPRARSESRRARARRRPTRAREAALPKQPPPRSAPGKPNSVRRLWASSPTRALVVTAGTIIATAAERLIPRFVRGPSPDELAAARRAAARRVRWPPPLVHPRNLDEDAAPRPLVCPITHQLFRNPRRRRHRSNLRTRRRWAMMDYRTRHGPHRSRRTRASLRTRPQPRGPTSGGGVGETRSPSRRRHRRRRVEVWRTEGNCGVVLESAAATVR